MCDDDEVDITSVLGDNLSFRLCVNDDYSNNNNNIDFVVEYYTNPM
jgi:hypothetical protein